MCEISNSLRPDMYGLISVLSNLSKGLNSYKACIYGLCRDFLDGIGYDLGTKYLFTFRYSSFIA